jgi:hypothetical protein
MITPEDITAKLEPDIAQFAKAIVPRMDCDTMLLLSIAISAKRIADSLDDICKFGITTND